MGGGDNYWGRLQQRRVSRRRFLAGGGVAAAGSAALLAGCGSDAPAPPPVVTEAPTRTETSPPTVTETPETTATTTATTTPTPDPLAYRRGGTLKLWNRQTEVDWGLDPGIVHVFHVNNGDVVSSTLTQPLTYQPTKNLFAMDGMVGYEQVDPLTLVWSIRPGMKFHNGDPVDSEAVAFSFGRLAKLNDVLEARGDGGTHVTREGYDFADSFEPTDDLTLTEHWSWPNADALVHRARHYYSFLNPRVVQEQGTLEGTYTAPDGTPEDVYSIQDLPFGSGSGPYVLTKRDETGTRVERWPDYHKHTPAGDGFVEDGPYIDAWETRVIPDRTAAKAVFLAGDLDVYSGIYPDELDDFREVDHVEVTELPVGGFSMMGMDGAKFHDRRARQALQKAIDYEGFIEAIRPLGGRYAAPVSDLLPHLQQLSQKDLQQWHRYDPKEARALWAAADFDIPVEKITVRQIGGKDSQYLLTDFVARSLQEALSIETEAFAVDDNFYVQPPGEPKSWEILSYGLGRWGGTTGIPHDSHLAYFDPRVHGTALNHSHLIDSPRPEIEADARTLTGMLETQQAETNLKDRAVLLTQIQRWILDRAWCVLPLPVSTMQYFGVSSRLRDFAPNDWLNFYDLRRESMWLADA